MNTPWILDEAESDMVAKYLLNAYRLMWYVDKNQPEVCKLEALLAQYCGPRKLSIDYKEWKFVRFI